MKNIHLVAQLNRSIFWNGLIEQQNIAYSTSAADTTFNWNINFKDSNTYCLQVTPWKNSQSTIQLQYNVISKTASQVRYYSLSTAYTEFFARGY